MAFEYPRVLDTMKEFPAIYNMNDIVNPAIDAENLELDLFIGTATQAGIARREMEYGINPKDTDSIEERRFRVRTKENERLPYTEAILRKKIEDICGIDGYYMEVLTDTIIVKVQLGQKSMFDTIRDLLENIVPVNIVIKLGLLYNTYENLSQMTYGQMGQFTYKQLKEEVL